MTTGSSGGSLRVRCVLLLLSTLLVAGCSLTTDPEPREPRAKSKFPGVTVSEAKGTPYSLADVDGEVWTALTDAGLLRREDGTEIELGASPIALADTPFGLWVSLLDGVDGVIVRIDPDSGKQDLRVGLTGGGDDTAPAGLTFDGQALWVIDAARERLVPVDPSTGAIGKSVVLGRSPQAVASGHQGVFVSAADYESVMWIRPRAGRGPVVDYVTEVCNSPQNMAIDITRVWVACPDGGGQVVTVDPRTAAGDVTVDLPYPHDIVLKGEFALAVLGEGPAVAVMERGSGRVIRTVRLGNEPRPLSGNLDAIISGQDLVVAHPGVDLLFRIRLGMLFSEAS